MPPLASPKHRAPAQGQCQPGAQPHSCHHAAFCIHREPTGHQTCFQRRDKALRARTTRRPRTPGDTNHPHLLQPCPPHGIAALLKWAAAPLSLQIPPPRPPRGGERLHPAQGWAWEGAVFLQPPGELPCWLLYSEPGAAPIPLTSQSTHLHPRPEPASQTSTHHVLLAPRARHGGVRRLTEAGEWGWSLKLAAQRLHLPVAGEQPPDVSLPGPRSSLGSCGMNEALCSSAAGRGTQGSSSGGVSQAAAAARCSLSPSKATGSFGEEACPQPPEPWRSWDSQVPPQALTVPPGQEP